jgi:DNA-binding transcriptional regulator GbsR (MarR family)
MSKYLSKLYNPGTKTWDYNYGNYFNGSTRMEKKGYSLEENTFQSKIAQDIDNTKSKLARYSEELSSLYTRVEQELREVKSIEKLEGVTPQSKQKRALVLRLRDKVTDLENLIDNIHENMVLNLDQLSRH